jgi:NAD(P)-dependent dehydrogenase (short-subunit alcohol dehydrogenase family)
MDFTGKTAVITGAARGIGLAIAQRFSQAGATIVLCDVDEAGVTQAAAGLPGQAIGVRTNVTSTDDIARLFEVTLEKFGRVDIVVTMRESRATRLWSDGRKRLGPRLTSTPRGRFL